MIGVFDSGFGGLTVLRALLRELPEYDYLYLGDSARAPYGNHSAEMVTEWTRQGVEHLFEQGCKLVILACNTASACALRQLQEELVRSGKWKGHNVLGVVVPIAEAVAASEAERVALIGTRGTVSSGVYENEILARREAVKVKGKACPLLVPLIEEGWAGKMETKRVLKSYLRELKHWNPDVLVPACTHYPILQKEMQQIMGAGVEVLDTGAIVAASLADYLQRHPEYAVTSGGVRRFLTTDCVDRFGRLGALYLGHELQDLSQSTLQ